MTSRDFYHFGPADRPPIDVGVGTLWFPGELIAWILRNDAWYAHVSYVVDGSTCKATVPADRTRSADPRGRTPALDPVATARDEQPAG